MIGLMGIKNDGKTLISPKGTDLVTAPKWLAKIVQIIQHKIAMKTWR